MELQKERNLTKKHISFLVLLYSGFIVYALYYSVFGTNAPVMMEHFSITSAQQGLILTTQGMGALLLSVYLALHGERYNKIYIAGIGVLIAGGASVAIGFAPSYTILLLLVVFTGAGYTTFDIMGNGMIPELFPKQKSTLLPLLHAFFGAGAMVTPMLVATMVNPDVPVTFTRPFMIFGILAIVVIMLFFIVSKRVVPETPYADMDSVRKRVSESPADIFKEKKAWYILAASFLYFTYQAGIVSWLPSYCLEIGMDFSTAGGMLTAYFAGALIMRFCAPLFLKKLTAHRAYILFSLLSAAVITTALFLTTPVVMTPLLIIGGFMQGACVAFLFLMAFKAFPHRTASASALILISINIGSMSAPLWMGFIAEFTGYRIPLLLVCGSLALSVALVFLLTRDSDKV